MMCSVILHSTLDTRVRGREDRSKMRFEPTVGNSETNLVRRSAFA